MDPTEVSIPTTSRPPDDQLRTCYRIVRAPTTGELEALVLSDQIYGQQTHYYKGRTRPHTEPVCEACDDGHAPRWQGYLAVLVIRTRDLALFEFTGPASAPLVEYEEIHNSLRGAKMRAYRTSGRANARVAIRLERGDVEFYSAPRAPDVASILNRIWGVDRLLAHEAARANGRHADKVGNEQPDQREHAATTKAKRS